MIRVRFPAGDYVLDDALDWQVQTLARDELEAGLLASFRELLQAAYGPTWIGEEWYPDGALARAEAAAEAYDGEILQGAGRGPDLPEGAIP